MKKAVIKNFAIFTEKLQTRNFSKKRLQHKCFPLYVAKFLGTPILNGYFLRKPIYMLATDSDFLKQLQNTSEQLLLY